MTNAPERKLVAFAAVFTVSDVGRSLEFYLGRLGFREFFRVGDPPRYAVVGRDAVSLHLMPASEEARGLGRSSIYVFAVDAMRCTMSCARLAARSRRRQRTMTTACERCRCAILTATASRLARR